jgi:hypothetical protein
MLTYSAKIIIATLPLVILSSVFIQTSYSQQLTSNSSLNANGGTPNVMKYEAAREQFLKAWDQLVFEPRVATFVNESEMVGNGQYQEHLNVFPPGETIVLYVQPIGFGHKQIQGQNGEKLYLMNFTADIVLSKKDGTIVGGGQDIALSQPISHYRNTELYVTLTVTQANPFPAGDYVFKYTLKDQTTGKSFDITKDVTIS